MYVGLCAEFGALCHLDDTPEKAFSGIRGVVANAVELLREDGAPVPEPLSVRRYSGTLTVRIPPEDASGACDGRCRGRCKHESAGCGATVAAGQALGGCPHPNPLPKREGVADAVGWAARLSRPPTLGFPLRTCGPHNPAPSPAAARRPLPQERRGCVPTLWGRVSNPPLQSTGEDQGNHKDCPLYLEEWGGEVHCPWFDRLTTNGQARTGSPRTEARSPRAGAGGVEVPCPSQGQALPAQERRPLRQALGERGC